MAQEAAAGLSPPASALARLGSAQELWLLLTGVFFFVAGWRQSATSHLAQIISAYNENARKGTRLAWKVSSAKRALNFISPIFAVFVLLAAAVLGLQKTGRVPWRLPAEGGAVLPPEGWILCAGLALFAVGRSLAFRVLRTAETSLAGMEWNKAALADSIFLTLGERGRDLIVSALHSQERTAQDALKSGLRQKQAETAGLAQELRELRKRAELMKFLTARITAFEWCEVCYSADPEAATEFDEKATHVCASNCLANFLVLRGGVAEGLQLLLPQERA